MATKSQDANRRIKDVDAKRARRPTSKDMTPRECRRIANLLTRELCRLTLTDEEREAFDKQMGPVAFWFHPAEFED